MPMPINEYFDFAVSGAGSASEGKVVLTTDERLARLAARRTDYPTFYGEKTPPAQQDTPADMPRQRRTPSSDYDWFL